MIKEEAAKSNDTTIISRDNLSTCSVAGRLSILKLLRPKNTEMVMRLVY